MSNQYKRQADELAALMARGYSLKKASRIIARKSHRKTQTKPVGNVFGALILSLRDRQRNGGER